MSTTRLVSLFDNGKQFLPKLAAQPISRAVSIELRSVPRFALNDATSEEV